MADVSVEQYISFAKQFLDASFIESMFIVVGTLENCLKIIKKNCY